MACLCIRQFADKWGWIDTVAAVIVSQSMFDCLFCQYRAVNFYRRQTIQSLYAIASGGLAGLGLGNSRQKYLYVPEPQNDFIFSILCEELGFIGAALVVALFLLLLLRGMSIAVRARDKFGALLVVGFVVQVTLQAILNMAVVTNTIPNTGISLPFFSSGGTSLLMLLGEMGIVLSVSRQTDMV